MPTPPRDQSDETPGTQPQRPTQGRRNGRNWSDVIEELLEEARARGDFDDLKGKGQPLRLNRNPYAGDREIAFDLLKNNNLAPPEIERTKEIDADIRRADELLATFRRRYEALVARNALNSASDRRAYALIREKAETQYEQALRAINSKILSLNIVAPPALHRRRLDVEAKMQAFHEEFPRLEE